MSVEDASALSNDPFWIKTRSMDSQEYDPLTQLSARQRQLLELVASDVTASKALARETGLTPGSVDTLLMRSSRLLGVRDRRSAAIRYRELLVASQQNSELRLSSALNTQEGALNSERPIASAEDQFQSSMRSPSGRIAAALHSDDAERSLARPDSHVHGKSELTSEFESTHLPVSSKLALNGLVRKVQRCINIVAGYLSGPPLGGGRHSLRWIDVTFEIIRVAVVGMLALLSLIVLVIGIFSTIH